jgi:hypothetical protein
MAMHAATLDKLVWVLVYGGLLAACLGLFLMGSSEGLAWAFIGLGGLSTAAGALLLWVRSRLPEPAPNQRETGP